MKIYLLFVFFNKQLLNKKRNYKLNQIFIKIQILFNFFRIYLGEFTTITAKLPIVAIENIIKLAVNNETR